MEKKRLFCEHHQKREDCITGNYCGCEEPIRDNTYYECAYGKCCGYKCRRCGRFL